MRYTRGRFCRIRQKDTRFIKMRFTFQEDNRKDGTFMRNTLHPDRTFVHMDELTRQMQADPRPRHIVLVAGKEAVKNGSNVFQRNTFAIIFDRSSTDRPYPSGEP